MIKHLICGLLLFIAAGAAYTQPYSASAVPVQDNADALWLWSATGSQPYLEEFFKSEHPDIELELDTISFDLLQKMLEDPSLYTGPWPDIILGEDKTPQLLAKQGLALPLDDLIPDEQLSRLVPYTLELARGEDGFLYGLMYAITPVTMCYRRSMARDYLGTDDPGSVREYFSSWDAFFSTARLLRDTSGGNALIASGIEDIELLLYESRSLPWIVDDRLIIDESLVELVIQFKTFQDESLAGNHAMWGVSWFNDMNRYGKAFMFFFPLWGYEYVIKPNTPDNGADWALCPAPVPRFLGAQILSITRNSRRTDEAMLFLETICLSPSYQLWLNRSLPEVPAHLDALNTLSEQGVNGKANAMRIYREVAMQIDGRKGSSFDMEFTQLFTQSMKAFYRGELSIEQALDEFRASVKERYSDIQVE